MPPEHSYSDHRARYTTAIKDAQTRLKTLLVSDPTSWKRITNPSSSNSNNKSQSQSHDISTIASVSGGQSGESSHVLGNVNTCQVKVLKQTSGSVLKATLDIPLNKNHHFNHESNQDKRDLLESFNVALKTSQVRPIWDRLVEQASTLEIVDPNTRIFKTDYRLGWPASPRDTITISRTTSLESCDDYLIVCSTSLPRFADEPSYLRPCPPFVRSKVELYSWVIQFLPPPEGDGNSSLQQYKLRIELYWSWELNNNKFQSTSSQHPYQSHIPNLMISLISYIKSTTTLIPSSSSSLSLPSTSLPLHPQVNISSSSSSSRIPSLIYWSQEKGIEITREDWEESLFKFTVEWDLIASSVSSPPPTKTKTKRKITAAAPTSTTATTTTTTVDDSSAVLSGNDDDEESTVHEREEERGDEKMKRFDKEKDDDDDKVVLPAVVKIGLPIPAASSSANQGRDGWDIKITSSSSSTLDSSETVTTTTTDKGSLYTISLETLKNDPLNLTTRYVLKISHHHHQKDSSSSSSEKTQGLERYKLVINRLVGGKGVRLNGNLLPVEIIQREGAEKEDDYDHDHVDESRQEGDEEEGEKGWKRLLKRSFELEREYRDNHRNDSAISIRTTSSSTTTTTTTTTKQQHEISLLLRRSYIYFLSLLQEPPAKWKLIQDNSSSRGVTITQLVSPDPTLTIFKAEAVFVGVGVWDVFASVLSSWGTSNSNSWDKGIEESRLISSNTGNVGEKLSEVWWEKRKGNWPIAPRDSVTLRTSYKSPNSIHIFSFSIEDTNLFPLIPPSPPLPPTIRTQTDLSGWSIESLSPTTTSITLLDQSDPKGWSNKNQWSPQQLIQQVAGVRDFTIKFGAPPVVTRLQGGKKRKVSYDSERGIFKLEYQSDHQDQDQDLNDYNNNIELELRCDCQVWSPLGLELIIDPPPSSVMCLSRHRLSNSGGGLWLTIEHPLSLISPNTSTSTTTQDEEEEDNNNGGGKISVTVKKLNSKSSSSSDKGVTTQTPIVSINGAKVRVDVEVLKEDKIKQLELTKRKKLSPVPLDQYETLRTTMVNANNGGGGGGIWNQQQHGNLSSRNHHKIESIDKEEQKKEESTTTTTTTTTTTMEEQSTIDGDESKPSLTTTSDSNNGEDSTLPPPPPPPPVLPPSSSSLTVAQSRLEPAACALEALAYLQSFHAEQGPSLTDPAPGWTIVSERLGTVVRKKQINSLSRTVPIYRGDKIVQGLTGEEIFQVVTSSGLRKLWDDKIDRVFELESFGNGLNSQVLLTKQYSNSLFSSLPTMTMIFNKGRIFHTTSVKAEVKVPSASSTCSTSTVLFVATSSYTPSPPTSSYHFDSNKFNPLNFQTGEIILEGWILETLDPYTSSVLAIPSTRLSYFSCIDFKNSLLLPGLQSSSNSSNLAKIIQNVELLAKGNKVVGGGGGPIPRVFWPNNHRVQIEGPLNRDEGDYVWKLEDSTSSISSSSRVVTTNYSNDEKEGEEDNVFRALFKIGGKKGQDYEIQQQQQEKEKNKNNNNKTSSNVKPSLTKGTSLLKSELPRSVSLLNFGTSTTTSTAPPVLHKSSVTSELSHKRSRGSLRSKSPVAPPIATPQGESLSSSSSNLPPSSTTTATVTTTVPSSGGITVNDPTTHDLLVAEFIVDLKQYPHGYSVVSNSKLLSSSSSTTSDNVDGKASEQEEQEQEEEEPLSLDSPLVSSSSSSTSLTLPLRLTAHDAPLPTILTASLDAWKRANHLVRVLIPTSSITHPILDPLTGDIDDDNKKGGGGRRVIPEWYKILTEEGGALIDIKISPLPPPPTTTTSKRPTTTTTTSSNSSNEPTGLGKVTGQANRLVKFNGERITVQSQKESRKVLQKFEDAEDSPLQGPRLSRVPRRKRKQPSSSSSSTTTTTTNVAKVASLTIDDDTSYSTLPIELRKPLAISTKLIATPKPSTPSITDDQDNGEDDFEFPDPKSPGMMTPALRRNSGSNSPIIGLKSNSSTSKSRRGTTMSNSSETNLSGPLSAILGSHPLARLGSSIVNATTPLHHQQGSSPLDTVAKGGVERGEGGLTGSNVSINHRSYSFGFVLIVGLIAFLLGSFLRSLLTPADYIIYHHSIPSTSTTGGAVEKALLSAFDPHRHWREAKRLLELRTPFGSSLFGWDLIVAAVRRD